MGAGSSVSAEKYKGTDLPEATVALQPYQTSESIVRSLDPVVSDEGNAEPKRTISSSRRVVEELDSRATTADEVVPGAGGPPEDGLVLSSQQTQLPDLNMQLKALMLVATAKYKLNFLFAGLAG
ncbi:hypothetical protein AK812_SmicGene39045 [Symbiodinium microadriaticum]|uniref:Uncharacterized protein n=1 Tax=Symbiodinium microadriaticum TaxID=2951 RepID=A0A1Q9CC82_SYMMI|nr:hypothetical protein AK812_SmicGene39045 [Symbiodinium microadriaticum]